MSVGGRWAFAGTVPGRGVERGLRRLGILEPLGSSGTTGTLEPLGV